MSLPLTILLVVFGFTMVAGVPLTFAMLLSCVAYLIASGEPLYLLVHKFFTGIDTFTLMAIPFFTLAGDLMVASGTAEKMLKFANVMVGRYRGGLGYVTVFSSMLFGGCSGSAISEVAGLGKMQAKMMEQAGYPKSFGAALAIAASIQGAIIPPSIPMVLVGAVSGVSIGAMLIGGAIPGMMVGGAMAVVVFIQAGKLARGKEGASSWREIGEVTVEALPFLLMPVIILGGILTGVFTPTEASAVAAAYGFVLMAARHWGNLPWGEFGRILMRSGAMAAAVLMLSGASNVFSWILATEQLPRQLAMFLTGISDNPLVILVIVNMFLLVWGMFMDMLPAIFIIVPIVMPIGAQLGIDPVHFGVVITFNLVVGLITPPYGTALFTGAIVTGLPIETVVKAIWPFILSSLAILALITYVPSIVLVLPHFFGLR